MLSNINKTFKTTLYLLSLSIFSFPGTCMASFDAEALKLARDGLTTGGPHEAAPRPARLPLFDATALQDARAGLVSDAEHAPEVAPQPTRPNMASIVSLEDGGISKEKAKIA